MAKRIKPDFSKSKDDGDEEKKIGIADKNFVQSVYEPQTCDCRPDTRCYARSC